MEVSDRAPSLAGVVRAAIEARLIVWAFTPGRQRGWRRWRALLARRLLGGERRTDLRRGAGDPCWAAFREQVPVRPQPDPGFVRPPLVPFVRPHPPVPGTEALPPKPEISRFRVPADGPPDPKVQDWLQIVTEPYILWDAPKPTFALPSDYMYDDAIEIPRGHVPAYSSPAAAPRRLAAPPDPFDDLRTNRACFRLPPDLVATRRTPLELRH